MAQLGMSLHPELFMHACQLCVKLTSCLHVIWHLTAFSSPLACFLGGCRFGGPCMVSLGATQMHADVDQSWWPCCVVSMLALASNSW